MSHTRCTIQRVRSEPGAFTKPGSGVQFACGRLLMTRQEMSTGVCLPCATGHVTPTDDYATPAEFERAINSRSR